MKSAVALVDLVLRVFVLGLIVRVILNWITASKAHPLVNFLNQVYEPFLTPLRRLIKPIPLNTSPPAALDLAPLVLVLVVMWILHPLLLWVFH